MKKWSQPSPISTDISAGHPWALCSDSTEGFRENNVITLEAEKKSPPSLLLFSIRRTQSERRQHITSPFCVVCLGVELFFAFTPHSQNPNGVLPVSRECFCFCEKVSLLWNDTKMYGICTCTCKDLSTFFLIVFACYKFLIHVPISLSSEWCESYFSCLSVTLTSSVCSSSFLTSLGLRTEVIFLLRYFILLSFEWGWVCTFRSEYNLSLKK